MAQPDVASALVAWLPRTLSTIGDLADSAILIEVVCAIDNKFFKISNDTRENSWVQSFKKLEQMYQLLIHYYQAVLQLSTVNIDPPNLKSIARDGNLEETIKLENESNKAHEEYLRLIAEKETLEKTYSTLMDEHSELSSKYDDLQVSNEELRQKLREMESGKDFHLRAEIDNLRHEFENQRHETELLVERSNIRINELTRQVIDLTEQADKASQLNDQLDEHRHTVDRLKKAENVIEKYRKKLDEAADLRRTLKALEQDNRQLVERNQVVEDEYRKVAAYKSLMENYKKQIDALQVEKAELITQNNKLEYENKHMRTKIEAHEIAQSRDMESIRLLEDRVRELEMGDEDDNDKPDGVVNNVDQSIGDEISDALKGNTMTGLRLRVNELERELARVREGKPADGNADAELVILNHMLEDAQRAKAKLEKDYDKVQKEKLELESELRTHQNGSTANGTDKPENRKSIDRELAETRRKLYETQLKLTQAEKGDEINEDDLKSQNVQLHQQIAEKNKKIEASKQLVKGQHEIIDNYKSREAAIEAERKAYAEEISRLKV
ncbi:10465_t:CDS:10 [Racocetra fulgida]|uniref:10465_t:CDS:1 n=2 Tax=Glomeromycetes TaxID=214506 RepID=A0A9N8ZMF5_9GLOM|nr:10465_t:CDS:10 [Racocetra fulgida]